MSAKRQQAMSRFAFAVLVSAAALAGILWLMATPGPVYACSCVQPGSPSEELEKFSAVFAGRVISIEHSYDPNGRTVTRDDRSTIGFEVSAVWKGTVHEDMYITTPPTGGTCGFTFDVGEEYIVYAYDSPYEDGGYSTGICSRTALLGGAQQDLDELGPGEAPLAGPAGPAPDLTKYPVQAGVDGSFNFDFEIGPQGWMAGFADLPVDHDQSIYELDHGYRLLPEGLDGRGMYLQGHNRSDDLFMYLKTQVGGLRPNTTYAVSVSIDLATNVAAGLIGIGGSPGSSVFVKAGASTIEPMAAEGDNRHLRMNIDKGNQSRGGEAMVVIGNVAHPEVLGREYRIKTLDNQDQPLTVDTDSEGRVWLIVGTDSGFEGLTAVYYAGIDYNLSAVELPKTGGYNPTAWNLFLVAGVGAAAMVIGLGLVVHGRRLSRRGARSTS